MARAALTALGILAAPQMVSAHIADVVKTCDHLDVSVGLFDDGVQTRVTIDGNTTVRSGNGHWVFAWSETQAHSYTVVVDAVNSADDKTFTGEQQSCTPPADSTTTTTTTTNRHRSHDNRPGHHDHHARDYDRASRHAYDRVDLARHADHTKPGDADDPATRQRRDAR